MDSTNPSLLESLIEQAPDAVVFAGRDGVIQTWNRAAADMFGYLPADAIGQRLDIIVPEQFREAHWKGFERALDDGETKYRGQSLPTRAMKAGGENFYVELSFAIVHDAGGTVIGALAHARDINERFEQDRTTRRRLRELEAQLADAQAADRQ
jgi:PAS domain S-box-containing protein